LCGIRKKEREREERGKEAKEAKRYPKNNSSLSQSPPSSRFFFSAHTHTPFVVCFGILLFFLLRDIPAAHAKAQNARTNERAD